MSMPTLDQVKNRLRIEHDIEDEDIGFMRASAAAAIEEKVGRPIVAASRTWVIEFPYPSWDGFVAPLQFMIPLYPVKHEDPDFVTITGVDNVAVTDFRVNTETGLVTATGDTVFNQWPYTVVAKVGLDLMSDFATRIEPKLIAAFFDLCADWYQRRSPNAFAEGAGGGVITQYNQLGIPDRVCQLLESVRRMKAY